MRFYFVTKQESGRSMVEVLAVVAIMAILTISSINIFQYASNAVYANTIISEIKMRMVALSRHRASKDEATSLQTLKGFQKTPGTDSILNKYPITLFQPAGEKPVLIVSEIPLRICNQLKSKTNIPMKLNDGEQPCGDSNTASFDFSVLGVTTE